MKIESVHQTCWNVLLHTRRYRYDHRLLVVDALGSCDGGATVSTCRTRRCLSQRSSVRRSWMRPLGRPPCCRATGGSWTWLLPCPSSVQLLGPTSRSCDGTAPVSTYRARHWLSQRSSVRRSWKRLLARSSCCHEAAGLSTWTRLYRSSVQLQRPASCQCDGAATVSSSLARHCRSQRLFVCRS